MNKTYAPTPKAENVALFKHARFTFLTDRFVRIEHNATGAFLDKATFAVVNRDMPKVPFDVASEGDRHCLKTAAMEISYTDSPNPLDADALAITFTHRGELKTWRFGDRDPDNLKGTLRTLDRCKGLNKAIMDQRREVIGWEEMPLSDGLLSRSGYSVFDDSDHVFFTKQDGYFSEWPEGRDEGTVDIYFMAYGHDYRAALKDASEVFGKPALPPRYTLGFWYSRYFPFTDEDLRDLVDQTRRLKIPMDIMVVDMEWHKPGWTGYTWEDAYFPCPQKLLGWLHDHHIKTTFNLHPADGVHPHEAMYEQFAAAMGMDSAQKQPVRFDISDQTYMEHYFKLLHHPMEKQGVDFWWMDWQQGNTSNIRNLDPLMLVNKLHYDDMATQTPEKRPLVFSRYAGLGSGRYPVGFSGDTFICWESLATQPWFTATSANLLYGYWSHDIGGHYLGVLDPELFVRWIQFGIHSPLFRIHSSDDRRLWEQPSPYRWIMIEEVKKRYEMIPYIYTETKKGYDTGVSLCNPLYYHYPDEENAYTFKDQYMFGSEMIVAPVVEAVDAETELAQKSVWLPPGEWIDTAAGKRIQGGAVYTSWYSIEETPVFVKAGTILPGLAGAEHLDITSYETMIFTCYGGGNGRYTVYEDDGTTVGYMGDAQARYTVSQTAEGCSRRILLSKVEGSYSGFKTVKQVQLRFPCSACPEKVTLNGRELDLNESVGYDGKTFTALVKLGPIDLFQENRIEVSFPALSADLLDGMPGEVHKLRSLKEKVRKLMRGGSKRLDYEKDRLYFRMLGVCDRIRYNPEGLRDEIQLYKKHKQELKETVRDYLEVAREIVAVADATDDPEKIQTKFPELMPTVLLAVRVTAWARNVAEIYPALEAMLERC